jgi:hypothetical protein
MPPTEPQQTTASSTVEQWPAYLQDLHARIAHRFRRPEVRERVRRYLLGLLGEIRRKNGWQMAETIGDAQPRGTQRISLTAPAGMPMPCETIFESTS